MRKLLTLILISSSLFLAANAQEKSRRKERFYETSLLQNQETRLKFSEKVPSNTKAMECMPEATFSNAPVDFSAGTSSNPSMGYISAQKVEGFGFPIGAIRFFGIQGFFQSQWIPLNDVDPLDFEIKFYEDNEGIPGTLITAKTPTLNHVDTDVVYEEGSGDFNVFHWDFTPSTPIEGLPDIFWVSVANTNPDTWFLWIDQPDGLGSAARYNIATSSWEILEYDDSFGICIVPAFPDSESPAAPGNLTVTPTVGAIGANIEWINPSETFGGDPLTELSSVSLWVNDALTAEHVVNDPTIGANENYNFTSVDIDPGFYRFTIYGSNSAGNGLKVNQTQWLGKDIPESPTNVLLLMVGNDAKITWNAPVTGHNGGYIVPENTTYSIIRMPDETEVATNLNALEYIDNSIPSPGNYLYIVTAHNEEGEGGNAP